MINILKRLWDAQFFVIAFTWIVAIGFIGMFDFFDMQIKPERLKDADYWSETGSLLFAAILIFSMRLYNKYMELMEEDEKSQKKEQLLDTNLSKTGTRDIPEFIFIENTERRITAYKEKMNDKFQKLIDKITKRHPESLDTWLYGSTQDKLKDKYCVKLNRYKSLMTDEYIKENKHHLPVHFIRLAPNFIQHGVNSNAKQSANENPSCGVITALRDNMLSIILPIVTTSAIIAMTLTTTEEARLLYAFMILMKVFVLVIQWVSATIYAPSFYKKTYVSDLGMRYRLGEKYLHWRTGKNSMKKEAKEDAQRRRGKESTDGDTDGLQPTYNPTSVGVR